MVSLLDVGSIHKGIGIIDRDFQKRIMASYGIIRERYFGGIDLTFLMLYQGREPENRETKRIYYIKNYYNRTNYNIYLKLNFQDRTIMPKISIGPSGRFDLHLSSFVYNVSNTRNIKKLLKFGNQTEVNKYFEVQNQSTINNYLDIAKQPEINSLFEVQKQYEIYKQLGIQKQSKTSREVKVLNQPEVNSQYEILKQFKIYNGFGVINQAEIKKYYEVQNQSTINNYLDIAKQPEINSLFEVQKQYEIYKQLETQKQSKTSREVKVLNQPEVDSQYEILKQFKIYNGFGVINQSEASNLLEGGKQVSAEKQSDANKRDYIESGNVLVRKLLGVKNPFETIVYFSKAIMQNFKIFKRTLRAGQLLVKTAVIGHYKPENTELENIYRVRINENTSNLASYRVINITVKRVAEFITDRLWNVFTKPQRGANKIYGLSDNIDALSRHQRRIDGIYKYQAKDTDILTEYQIKDGVIYILPEFQRKDQDIYLLSQDQIKDNKIFLLSEYQKKFTIAGHRSADMERHSASRATMLLKERTLQYNDTTLHKIYRKIESWYKDQDILRLPVNYRGGNKADIDNIMTAGDRIAIIYIKGNMISTTINNIIDNFKRIFRGNSLIKSDNLKVASDKIDRIISSFVYNMRNAHRIKDLLKFGNQSEINKHFDTQKQSIIYNHLDILKQSRINNLFEILNQDEINKQLGIQEQFKTNREVKILNQPVINGQFEILKQTKTNKEIRVINQSKASNLLEGGERVKVEKQSDSDKHDYIESGKVLVWKLREAEQQLGTSKGSEVEKLLELEKVNNVTVQNAGLTEKILRTREVLARSTSIRYHRREYTELENTFSGTPAVYRVISSTTKRIVDFITDKLWNMMPRYQRRTERKVNDTYMFAENREAANQKKVGDLYILSEYQRETDRIYALVKYQEKVDKMRMLSDNRGRAGRIHVAMKESKEFSASRPMMVLEGQTQHHIDQHHIDQLKAVMRKKGQDIINFWANRENNRFISDKIGRKLLNQETIERYKAAKFDEITYADMTYRNNPYPDQDYRSTSMREDNAGIIFETEKSSSEFNIINETMEESIDSDITETQGRIPDIARIADQVYKKLEDRLRVERQRRGLFR